MDRLRGQERTVLLGGGEWGGTYGASALDSCAADFEIGLARYAWVFLEFCADAVLAAVSCLKDDRVYTRFQCRFIDFF